MKTGVILYVSDGREALDMDWEEPTVNQSFTLPKIAALCIATSEEEIAYNWWRLVTRGMHQVLCMKASCNVSDKTLLPFGVPLRLCG